MPREVSERKAALRSDVLAARAALDEASRETTGADIARHGLAGLGQRDTIAAYLSIGSEPPTDKLLLQLHSAGVRILVPVVDGQQLEWTAYSTDVSTTVSALGVPEPSGRRLGVDALRTAELVIVPALAVDRAGNRLGRGRGFYDRALDGISAPVVAVVYDREVVDVVPAEPHDRKVDAVLRPAGLEWITS